MKKIIISGKYEKKNNKFAWKTSKTITHFNFIKFSGYDFAITEKTFYYNSKTDRICFYNNFKPTYNMYICLNGVYVYCGTAEPDTINHKAILTLEKIKKLSSEKIIDYTEKLVNI